MTDRVDAANRRLSAAEDKVRRAERALDEAHWAYQACYERIHAPQPVTSRTGDELAYVDVTEVREGWRHVVDRHGMRTGVAVRIPAAERVELQELHQRRAAAYRAVEQAKKERSSAEQAFYGFGAGW